MTMFNPELPDDAGELVEAAFADDVEVMAAIEGAFDDTEHDSEAFGERVAEILTLEGWLDQ